MSRSDISRTLTAFLSAFALLLTAPATQAEQVTIGVSMHFMRDDYAVAVVDAIETVALKHGDARLVVTDANATASKQLADVENLVDFSTYFSFVTRMLLIFGVAMEIPFFVILLNLAGVISGRTLGRYRPWIVIGVFVFAAVATPSTDPFSMLMLAIPLQILFILAEIVARLVDRARGRVDTSTNQWGDDQASPI